MPDLRIREIRIEDHDTWAALFAEYREFCGREPSPEIVEQAWSWLMDPAHEIRGIAGEQGGRVVAIAHFRSYARTVDANRSLHLDDLYVAREARGNGTARALITHLGDIARDEGYEFVRWVTAQDNANARRLYSQIAEESEWITFELPPSPAPGLDRGAPTPAGAARAGSEGVQ